MNSAVNFKFKLSVLIDTRILDRKQCTTFARARACQGCAKREGADSGRAERS